MRGTWIAWVMLALSIGVQFLTWWLIRKTAPKKELRMQLAPAAIFSLVYAIAVPAGQWLMIRYVPQEGENILPMLLVLWPGLACLLFLALFGAIMALARWAWRHEDWQDLFALKAYFQKRQPDDTKAWRMKLGAKPYGKWFSQLVFPLVCLGALFNLVSFFVVETGLNAAVFVLPVGAWIAFEIWSLFLGGIPEAQSGSDFAGAPVQAAQTSRYALAAEHLKESFANANLYFRPAIVQPRTSTAQTLQNLQHSPRDTDQLAVAYFRSQYRSTPLDPDYIHAAADLMARKNTMIFNPFYEDLGMYLGLPLNESLMRKRRLLVLCSGQEIEKAQAWLSRILNDHQALSQPWKISQLEDLLPECEIGLLAYNKLFNPDVLAKNAKFFAECEYVVLLNPSEGIASLQIPLSILASQLQQGTAPVYCVLDQDLNGLKDILSHVLKSAFDSECVISNAAQVQTLMIWDADADFQSAERFEQETRFLGGGIELGAEAAAMQIPVSEWIAQSNVPLIDLQNQAVKGFDAITRRMNVEISQNALKDHLRIQTSLWDLPQKDAQFLIIEDEFNNPFAAARSYRSRGIEEVFLNVLSPDYLLRDYFCANALMFLTNPNAIGMACADYAKTNRNVLYTILYRLRLGPMSLPELSEQLRLAGLEENDPFAALQILRERYTKAPGELLELRRKVTAQMYHKPKVETMVVLNEELFDACFRQSLKNAAYVLEDESFTRHILDHKLYSLIGQILVPGQLLTYAGRSYKVKSISPQNGVILGRASDQVSARIRVRQQRIYRLPELENLPVEHAEVINGISFIRKRADIGAATIGFFETITRDGSRQVVSHTLQNDSELEALRREYKNKTILEIQFPPMDQHDLYDLACLLQSLLPTYFAQDHAYLAVLAARPDDVTGDSEEDLYFSNFIEEGKLVLIEDSELDLGLLSKLETRFFDLLHTAQDYLRWQSQDEDLEAEDKEEAPMLRTVQEETEEIEEDEPEKPVEKPEALPELPDDSEEETEDGETEDE